MATKCFSVIIAGGKGTRFWPLSRARRPKQLLKIIGTKSLIGATAERARVRGARPKREHEKTGSGRERSHQFVSRRDARSVISSATFATGCAA